MGLKSGLSAQHCSALDIQYTVLYVAVGYSKLTAVGEGEGGGSGITECVLYKEQCT